MQNTDLYKDRGPQADREGPKRSSTNTDTADSGKCRQGWSRSEILY